MISNFPEPFYGRRKGKSLKARHQLLMDRILRAFSINLQDDKLIHLQEIFGNKIYEEYWFEIGFGGGEHLAEQAEKNPHVGFIGAEAFVNGVASLVRLMDQKQLTNIRIFSGDGRRLLRAIPAQSLSKVVILFPDPWPKLRHHKRRLINEVILQEISRVLMDGGELRIASDHEAYIQWVFKKIKAVPHFNPAEILTVKPQGWESTRYERKALSLGDTCYYMSFSNGPNTT